MQLDLNDYSTAAEYAREINAGYNSNLFGINECTYTCDKRRQAFQHGWDMAQRAVSGCA